MKKIAVGLMIMCAPLVLMGAEHRQLVTAKKASTPPPGYEEPVKVHLLDGKGGNGGGQPLHLSSSPSTVLGAFSAVASYCFSSPYPAVEPEKERVAREMRDAVLGRNCLALRALLEKYGVEPAEALGPDKYNPFHMACFNQYMEGIEVLTCGKTGKKGQRKKVIIDFPNGKGKTPLQVALSEMHVAVAAELVKLGSSVEDEEVLIVRDLRRRFGKDNEQVKALADLLAGAKQKTILNSIFDTDSEAVEDDEDGADQEL